MTNCTISNIKFKVAHCCVVVYALSFSRNWLKVFFFFMQRLLGSLESIDDTAEITVIVLLLLRKKSVNSRQR